MQLNDPSSASMTGVDKCLADKQARISEPCKAAARKDESAIGSTDQSTSAAHHSSSGETSSDSDTNFVAPIVSKSCPAKKIKNFGSQQSSSCT